MSSQSSGGPSDIFLKQTGLAENPALPPRRTVFRWFSLWPDTGLFETLNHHLVMADRERVGREADNSPLLSLCPVSRAVTAMPGDFHVGLASNRHEALTQGCSAATCLMIFTKAV